MTGVGRQSAVPVLDIGGTHVTAALAEPVGGTVLPGTRHRMPLAADAPAGAIIDVIARCAGTLDVGTAARWGVAVPGPFDYANGIGLFAGVGKFDALYGVDLRTALLNRLGGRASEMVFVNDAEAFLLGEWRFGVARGSDRVVGITLGTGVGSAFLSDGTVIDDDPAVPPQGRVDLLTVAGRPLEETVSRRAIRARYAEVAGFATSPPDVGEIADGARSGDTLARTVFDEVFTALGSALAPWLASFRATVLVIGGSMSGSLDLIKGPLWTGIGAVIPHSPASWRPVAAAHHEESALLGAAYRAGVRPPP